MTKGWCWSQGPLEDLGEVCSRQKEQQTNHIMVLLKGTRIPEVETSAGLKARPPSELLEEPPGLTP